MTETTSMASSTSTQPSTDGPTTMPATISSTIDGNRRAGARPSRNGTVKATAMTMSRPLNSGMACCRVTAAARYA